MDWESWKQAQQQMEHGIMAITMMSHPLSIHLTKFLSHGTSHDIVSPDTKIGGI